MKLKNYLLLYLMAMWAITGCKQKTMQHSTSVLKTKSDVYVAGAVKAPNGHLVAAYWKNGICTKLADDTLHSYVTGIAIKGKDVFIAGNYTIGKDVPVYWKNGVVKKLTHDKFDAVANGIAISDAGDVYVVGNTTDKNGNTAAVYWKNGDKAVALSPRVPSVALAVAINETGVYFAGSVTLINGTKSAAYWKDGVYIKLGKSSSLVSEATAITLNGADVFIAGDTINSNSNIALVYWKNKGTALPFKNETVSTYAKVEAIAVNKDQDVYGVGYTMDGITDILSMSFATYWKNNTISETLKNGQEAKAIALDGDDVYITGTTSDDRIAYWKNDVINYLLGGVDATGIVVVTYTGN